MKKKLFAILLSIVMVAGLLPTVALCCGKLQSVCRRRTVHEAKSSLSLVEKEPQAMTRIQRPLRLNNATIDKRRQ